MAANVCDTCGVHYPLHVTECRVCAGRLVHELDAAVDVDWREITDATLASRDERAKIVAWRRGELERAGYDQETADAIAGRVDIDLHVAVTLVRDRGCRPVTAVGILA